MENFGTRVKAAREAAGLSHEQLVVKMHGRLKRQSLINIEKHGQLPKADKLREIALALEVSADHLLGLSPGGRAVEEAMGDVLPDDDADDPPPPASGTPRRTTKAGG